MTEFSKTITNSIRAFGIGPATQWGTGMVWGTSKWGEGSTAITKYLFRVINVENSVTSTTDLTRYVTKGITDTVSSNSDVVRYVFKLYSNAQASTSDVVRTPLKVIDNSQASTSDLVRVSYKGVANAVGSDSALVRDVTHIFANTQATTSDVIRTPYKGIANAITSTDALVQRDVTKVIDNTQASTSELVKNFSFSLSGETVVCSEDLGSIKVYDRAGYCDNFPGGKQDARDRIWDQWTSLTTSTDGFTEASVASTTWSDAS